MIRSTEEIIARLKGNHSSGKLVLATVSGVATTKPELISYVDRNLPQVGLITTKSFQIAPNSGNREPIITEIGAGNFGNSVGLRNPGMEVALRGLQRLLEEYELRSLLNISVSASSPEDFISLIETFAPLADTIELNFSCPHASAGFGSSIGCDQNVAVEYMQRIRDAVGRTRALIIPKLTPNVEDIGSIARALTEAGADGISAINTVGPELYVEPYSGKPILNNRLGGKGGKSGLWIRERALEAIGQIREAIGEDGIIIGSGGVSSGADAAAMLRAGADTVGLGSIFGRVHQRDWAAFTKALYEDALGQLKGERGLEESSSAYVRRSSQMDYTPSKITSIIEHESGVKVFSTDTSLSCGPGQYAFIWLPGIGEKPFSIAESEPLTFIIKARGHFTEEMMRLKVGDTLYTRGVYGEQVELPEANRAVILAGGTGIAVVPSLVRRLKEKGVSMRIYYGASGSAIEGKLPLLKEELSSYGEYTAVYDDGTPARVIDVMEEQLCDCEDTAFYTIGPEIFMKRACRVMEAKGVDDTLIYMSMERPSMCGIGMCGECACGDRLTCQYGTFVRRDFIREHAREFL